MKITHVNSVPLAHGELSIVLSESAENMLAHSTKLASDIRKLGVGTLIINCGVSEQRFNEHINPHISSSDRFYKKQNEKETKLVPYSTCRGDLIGEFEAIDELEALYLLNSSESPSYYSLEGVINAISSQTQ